MALAARHCFQGGNCSFGGCYVRWFSTCRVNLLLIPAYSVTRYPVSCTTHIHHNWSQFTGHSTLVPPVIRDKLLAPETGCTSLPTLRFDIFLGETSCRRCSTHTHSPLVAHCSFVVGRSLIAHCWSLVAHSPLVARCSLAVGRSLLTRRWLLVARSPLVARCSTLFHAHSLAVGRPLLAHRWSREARKTMKNCVREMNKSGARVEFKNYKLPP